MKSVSKLMLAACVASALLPLSTMAQDAGNQGYWVSSSGNVVRSGTGLCWRAGYWTPSMANAECDPDLVAKPKAALPPIADAAPAPAPMPAPARAMPQRVSLSADALFDFDKSVLKPSGIALLDKLVDDLSQVSYDTIAVTGHTDRIGSAAYNQKLSEHRAHAVKTYLESKGISANRITAEGRGKAQPVTDPSDCKGRVSKKVIACLQPDRRVDVEVSGAK